MRLVRLLAVKGVSFIGLVALVAWEIWKATDFTTAVIDDGGLLSGAADDTQLYQLTSDELNVNPFTVTREDVASATVQKARKEQMSKHCHDRKRNGIWPKGSNSSTGIDSKSFANIIVSDKHQLLYCAIPKVACTNWKRVFLTIDGYASNPYDVSTSDVHNRSFGMFKRLSDFSPEEITFRLSNYYKFLFVRHPFERLVSAFRNKFVESYDLTHFKHLYGKFIINKYRKGNLPNGNNKDVSQITFNEFVRYIIESPAENKNFFDRHWERYDRLCLPCMVYYDFVGKFETLETDSKYLLKILDLSDKVSFPMNLSSGYSLPTKVLSNIYYSQLDDKTRDELADVYNHDYGLFGYKRPHLFT